MALFGPSDGNTESSGLFSVTPDQKKTKYRPKKPTIPGAVPGQTGGTTPNVGKQELPFIFGVGQTALKGLLTSGAAGIEIFDAAISGSDQPLTNAGKNIQALWGPKDVFEPGAWDKLKTGEDVVRERFNITDPTWQFWLGLGLDIATDPLTYGTLGLAVPFKVAASFTRASAQGTKLAAAREISEKLAQRKVGEPVEIFNERPVGVSKKLARPDLQSVRNNIIKSDPKAAAKIKQAEEKLAANTYKTVRVTDPRTLSQAGRDVVASAIDAGVKAASNAYVSVNTVKFLEKYANKDSRRFGRGIVINATRNPDTNLFELLSGNGIKLSEATYATKAEAQAAAKALREGIEPASVIVPVSAVAGARKTIEEATEQAEGAVDSVVLPTVDNATVEIEQFVPHQADNGKTYVYDGENIAEFDNLQDATTWINTITEPTAREAVTPVVSGKKGNYQVRVGESVTRFTTKREADAYAKAIETGEVPLSRRVTTGGTPIIDTPAPAVPLKEALKAPTKAEASVLRKVLAGIDKVSKKASGWRPEVNQNIANQLRQIIDVQQGKVDNFLLTLNNSQLSALRSFINLELSAKEFFAILDSTGQTGVTLGKLIRGLAVTTTKGTRKIGELLDEAKGNILDLDKKIEGVEGAGLTKQVIQSINTRIYKRAQQLKTKAILPASTVEGKYQAIVAVAGEEIAERIQKTGYLQNPSAANKKKFDDILEQISVGSTEVSYQGYDDLIAGLQRGDEVSANVLEEIINLIDPEGALKAQVTQATAEPAQAYLTRLLTREGGVETIYDAERRLTLAKDKKMLMKHPNLAYEAEVVSMMELADSPNKFLAENLELASTRQAFAESFANYRLAVQRDAMDSFGRAIMGDPTKGGAGGRQAYLAGIMEEATGQLRTSSLGDEIYSTGEAYADGSRAQFAKQLQQSDEVRVISSILGKRGAREKQAKQTALEAGDDFEALSPEGKLDYLVERMSAVRDGAGGLGFRFVRTKNRDDIAFQKSYDAAIQAAKKSKTTPNFSALSEKHTAYLPMADILTILKNNGALAGLLKGYFPTGKVKIQRDVMDWYGLGDAARRVVEMDAAGEVFDMNEIAMRIMRRGLGREVPSDKRLEIFKEAANDIAEVLTQPEVVAQLKAVHLDNAASIVKDFIQKVEDYSKSLFDILDEAWVAMHATDDLSEAARMNAVRLFFRKFVLTSDIMRLQGGPIAEAMFRAAAMTFADGGKVLPQGKIGKGLTPNEAEFYNLLREDEMRLFRESLVRYYRFADIPTAPVGREGMPVPKKAAQAKAQAELDTAMEIYAKHMDELSRVEATGDLTLIKTWEKDMAKIQKRLDKARETAWNNWVQTFHWHPSDGWVRSEQFNHAQATRAAEAAHAAYVAGARGVADRELLMADTAPVIPPHRILNKSEKAKFLKKHRIKTTEASIDNAKSIVDDISRNVADEVQLGALDLEELGGVDKMMIAAQNTAARSIKETTEIRLYKALASYKDRLPDNPLEFNALFRPMLNPETPVTLADRVAAKTKLMAQRWSATSRGTSEAIVVARTQENMATQVASDYASALDDLVRSMQTATVDDMDAAWTALRDGIDLPLDDVAIRIELRDKLAPFVNAILRNESASVLTQTGIDGAAIGQAFARYGLTDEIGFPSVRELEGKTAEEVVASLFNQLPFGSVPTTFKPGSQEAIMWAKARDRFRKSQTPPPLVFSRMFSAVQQLKAEQGIAHNLTAQFGWKSHFKTFEEAKKAGWVQIEAAGKQNIARFLPDAEGGNLFHPQVAESIGRVFREWNAIYESPALPAILRSSMRLLGFLKFTQTTARPGHHIVNLIGDGSNAIIFGARSPKTWADGLDIANRYTKVNLQADYGKLGKDFEAKAQRIVGALREMPGAEMPAGPASDTIKFTFYRDGKPTAVNFDRQQFAEDLGRRGALVPGFVQGDIMNATNDIMLTGTTNGNRRGLEKAWSVVARPGHELMRGLSAGTAAYSNVIRASTAIRVAQSRAWSSYEEMLNGVMKEVNLIHPTVQSLASAEKKWGRLIFTYYTWLRVAHNALWDMAINHTGALLAIPKAQYNYANLQGFDPQSPAVPFENQNVLPDYLSYSVYGPTQMAEQGPRTVRPPMMVLDVLDFWKMWYDPSKPLGQNAVQMTGQLGENVIGPSLNILGQPIGEAVFGGVGGPRDIGEAAEGALGNLGFMNLLTGLGAYTPYRYRREDTTNPLTDADRQRLLTNWFTGARAQDLYRPINVKLGQSQYGSRVKQYNERIQKENVERVQGFVDDRISEGYTREQILEMLKQMGIN